MHSIEGDGGTQVIRREIYTGWIAPEGWGGLEANTTV